MCEHASEIKTIELDIESTSNFHLNELVRQKIEHIYGIKAKLITEDGPGGRNPLYEITGENDKLVVYMSHVYFDEPVQNILGELAEYDLDVDPEIW